MFTPIILAIAGRRVDPPNPAVTRFPASMIIHVETQIHEFLSQNAVVATVSAAACGVDLIALDVSFKMKLKSFIVLPSSVEDFRSSSVTDRPGDWGVVFDTIIARSSKESLLSVHNQASTGDESYKKGNELILKKTLEVADEVNGKPMALIVWDGIERESPDITAAFAREARSLQIEVNELIIGQHNSTNSSRV